MSLDQVVLVTGCSSGVGLHTAVQLAQKGYTVIASMRDLKKRDALDQLAAKVGVELQVLALDVESGTSITAAVEKIINQYQKIDVLINNAGAGHLNALEAMTDAEIARTFEINFFGAIRCIRAVLPHMRQAQKGHVISVSSVGGIVGQPFNEVYCAAKFALEGLVESLAVYMEPFFGIKFTLIEPAGIKSDFFKNATEINKPAPSALDAVYASALKTYLDTVEKRGSFEKYAQTSEEVAAVIVNTVVHRPADLRVLTSPVAKAFTHEKTGGDPSGCILQQKVRTGLLGL
jgi:NAD(P)-dependent dehydrogenase (short-subunit alcohol dehydrogenase family)